MEIYINGTGCISPQTSFEESAFSLDSLQATNTNRLKCIEPEYKNYINPALLRRMSRMIRMGVTSAKLCLENAGVTMPGAIIIGTGLGCVEDTEKFLLSILENNEQLLTPTPFIQSTHNTVGGQIALLLGCHEYNFTYVHRGISFESSLLDATMMIHEKSADTILVGGIDELTNHSFRLLQQLGIYSKEEKVAADLSSGTPGGEGAAFFLVSGIKNEKSQAKISFAKTFSGKNSATVVSEKITATLLEHGKKTEEIDLVLTGDSGNASTDVVFKELKKGIFKNSTVQTFKQYCGEYHTSTSFALWLALKQLKASNLSSVLICNRFDGASEHSIILIEKC